MSDEYWYDEEAGDKAVAFFSELLHHVKGEWGGQPLELDEWQAEQIVRPLFGWKRKDGTRKYRQVYVEIPRKNGKTTLAAGIGLYLLFADGEVGAEVYSAAADRDQAAIAFDLAASMVAAEPALANRAKVYRRSIVVESTGSSYKVLSADARTKHGFNAHGIIFDELHAQPNRELYDVLHTSTGARRQPLEFYITTAGVYDKHSICWELHEYAEKVRDGVIEDEAFLGVIFAADKDDDYTDPDVWKKANPGLGTSVKPEYLKAEAERAKELPSYQNTFRRLHLNQWTEQVTRWLDMDLWDECEDRVDEAELLGRECFGGLDLSTTTDIAAWVLVFPGEDGRYDVLPRFFIPDEAILRRSRRDGVPYDVWERQGLVTATEGDVVDYMAIRQQVNEDAQRFKLREVAFDPWNATQLATQLGEEDGLAMLQVRQGYQSLNEPTKELEKRVTDGRIRHGGNAVLRWMASNVAIKTDPAGNIKPDKGKSTERIDGIVALVMALSRAMVRTDTTSVYETRGIEAI